MSRSKIVMEPCTLVYTLLDSDAINFDDMCLLIKSLHNYCVTSIDEFPNENCVHVNLEYQASLINTRNKMGELINFVSVNKLNANIAKKDLPRLEQLRSRFGLSSRAATTPPAAPAPKRRKVNTVQPGGSSQAFARPKPYSRPSPVPIVQNLLSNGDGYADEIEEYE